MNSQLSKEFNAEVLFQNNNYSIEKYLNKNTNEYSLVVVKDKIYTDWIIIYDNGAMAFDNPYRLAGYIKAKVYKIGTGMYLHKN